MKTETNLKEITHLTALEKIITKQLFPPLKIEILYNKNIEALRTTAHSRKWAVRWVWKLRCFLLL
jgi:hypothetical protein